jgi:hypothetical protein
MIRPAMLQSSPIWIRSLTRTNRSQGPSQIKLTTQLLPLLLRLIRTPLRSRFQLSPLSPLRRRTDRHWSGLTGWRAWYCGPS